MNKQQTQDTELLARAQAGNKNAFGDLYEKYLDDIYQYVFYRVSNRQDAEDLTEMAFLKAWQALSKNPPQEVTFRLWMYRIAHNTVIDHYRTREQLMSLDEAQDVRSGETRPESTVVQNERNAWLKNAIGELKEEHQHVLLCRFVIGLTHSETAVVMERSAGAVRILQLRAVEALRKILLLQEKDNYV